MARETFRNAQAWRDKQGRLIQAHGGQVQRLTYTDRLSGQMVTTWWWVGEDKTEGTHGGICAYSSEDLLHWQFEGIVMRNIESREQLKEEPYFQALYQGASEEELEHIYICLSAKTAIIERPKLVYNEKTGMYVMWFHADGPTRESQSSYAAASAGVAICETPYGPFRFLNRYRLHTCPEGEQDFYPQSKGMSRDMNLYVDADKTAYIVYASEENLTLYLSKLNETYTYLAAPPEQAVYGVDYIRLYPGAQREAPALWKRGDYYYLLTSGCTGWAPNQARYYRSQQLLGAWENLGDPCVGDEAHTTFDSQSTCVFSVETKQGTYDIYMGDCWHSEALDQSGYLWLPITYDKAGYMKLAYREEWSLEELQEDGR